MSSIAIPASLGTADQQAEQATSAVDASLVAVPEIRLPVDARGLAIVAAFASVLALWLAQAFVVPLLLGIPIIVIVKVVSQHITQLHPIAELLGD